MFLCEEDYERLKKSFPNKAVCEQCGGEMVFVVKSRDNRRIFFYLCRDPKCGNNTEPFLVTLI